MMNLEGASKIGEALLAKTRELGSCEYSSRGSTRDLPVAQGREQTVRIHWKREWGTMNWKWTSRIRVVLLVKPWARVLETLKIVCL